jgi:hypothetical protein
MRARLVLIPLVVAVALVAGCEKKSDPDPSASATPSAAPSDNGVAQLPGSEILSKALAAASSAKSVRVKGEITVDGDKIGLDLTVSGANGKGSVTAEGHTVELIRLNNAAYMKAGEEFWKMISGDDPQPAVAALLKDRWVKAPPDEGFAEIFNLLDTGGILPEAGPATKGETKTINGINAIGLTDETGEAVIYVATQGEPFPLRFEGPAGEGAIDFTDWNAPVEITAPPASEVLDMSQIS